MVYKKDSSAVETHPVIKRISPFDISMETSVGQRLRKISGIKDFNPGFEAKKENSQDVTLRQIVERNYKKTTNEAELRNYVPNFHWVVMRARRGKHLTQKQLASAIGESEIAITMLEKGIPANSIVTRKVEDYLGVRIKKQSETEMHTETRKELDISSMRNMRLSDIKKDSNLGNKPLEDFSETELIEQFEDFEDD